MSLFSSLVILLPGPPPKISVRAFRDFSEALRDLNISESSTLTKLKFKFGDSIDCDYEDTSPMEWNASGTSAHFLEYPWDHQSTAQDWESLWPPEDSNSTNLYRGYFSFGSLKSSFSSELTAMKSSDTQYEFFSPDQLSVQIDPVLPSTLDTELPSCFSFISVNLSGNGFISWQELSLYWDQIRASPELQSLLGVCRQAFPAPEFQRVEDVLDDIGCLFLNYSDYAPGDWIVTVQETG